MNNVVLKLNNLRELDIRENDHLRPETFKNFTLPNVYHLVLSETFLPLYVLKSFPMLEFFSVNSNENLTTFSRGRLRSFDLRSTINLKILHLDNCSVKKIDEDAFDILENSLEELNLRSNRLSRLSRKTFIRLKRLKSLDLSYNKFRDRNPVNGSYPIKPLNKPFFGMFGSGTLENLALAGNNLRWIPDKLLRQLKSLKFLNLAGNRIENIQWELMNNFKLEYLNINNNWIKFIQWNAFRNLRYLKQLNLGSNRLIDINSIRFPYFVEEVNLSYNKIKFFPNNNQSSFSHLKFIRTLDLSFNFIRTVEIKSLSHLKDSLIYIDLGGAKVLT